MLNIKMFFLPFLLSYAFLILGVDNFFNYDLINDVSFLNIFIGFFGGIAYYFFSLKFFNFFSENFKIFEALKALWRQKISLNLWGWTFFSAALEEIIWRLYGLSFSTSHWQELSGLVLCSLLFSLSHFKLLQQKQFCQLFELFLYGFILGLIFIATNSLTIVIVMHAVRNIALRKFMLHSNNKNIT